jgi:hypothetical protein
MMNICRSKRKIKAQERHINIRSNEPGMSVGDDLGRSSNVFLTSERPPVRMSGGPVDVRRMFWTSEYGICRKSVGLPCVIWDYATLEKNRHSFSNATYQRNAGQRINPHSLFKIWYHLFHVRVVFFRLRNQR